MRKIITVVAAVTVVFLGVWFCLFCLIYPLKYESEITNAAAKYDVSPSLIASLINAESSFNKNKISKKGAIGLMQVLPSTANYVTDQNLNLFNAADNIDVGVHYLANLIKKFGDVDTALFAYNAGEGNVTRWLSEQGTTKLTSCPFPETNAYVEKIKKGVNFYRGRL